MTHFIDPSQSSVGKTFAIGARLESLLQSRSLTPYELARKSGVNERSVRRHLRNLPASRQVVKYYADAFKISVEEFLQAQHRSHLPAYLAWLGRAFAEVPFWPNSHVLRRPSLKNVYIDLPLSEGPDVMNVPDLRHRGFVVVTGKAGVGKTTLVHALASGCHGVPSETIPLLIDLHALTADDSISSIGDLFAWIRTHTAKLPILPFVDELPALIEHQPVMFLVDGLHELDGPDQAPLRRAIDLLNFLPRDYPTATVIVTCRDECFERIGSRLRSEYTRIAIGPMHARQVTQLVQKIGKLAATPHLESRLERSVELHPELGSLLTTALGTTILALALLEEAGKDLCTISDVLDHCFHGLLQRMVEQGWSAPLAHRAVLDLAGGTKRREQLLGGLLAAMAEGTDGPTGGQPNVEFVHGLSLHCGLVEEKAGLVQLNHDMWRHYLLARESVDNADVTGLGAWLGDLLTATPMCPEVDALVQSALARICDKRPGDLMGILGRALDGFNQLPDTAVMAGAHRLRLLATGLRGLPREREVAIRDRLRAVLWRALPLLEAAQPSMSAAARVAFAEALGVVGDPRAGRAVRVPGGAAFVCNELRDVPAFWISATPITVGEFGAFIRAVDPYNDPSWWPGDVWLRIREFCTPSRIVGRAANGTPKNAPVTGLNWFEADAFCRWRGGQLPPAEMWETAGRGALRLADGATNPAPRRRFPWGETITVASLGEAGHEVMNSRYTHPSFLRPTPVGCFPAGASPYGVLDLVGNVFEWSGSFRPRSDRAFVVGGSYLSPIRHLTLDSDHTAIDRFERHRDVGFRCLWLAEPRDVPAV
jgi:energy-coupling factor transporter ATP-binding protein EcfA2